ncbi:hypothetical protein GCM10027591_12070 [Zhihengliuella somnathii]
MDIAELLECEHAGWRALCSGTGAEHYGRTMTKDAVMVLAHGEVLTREQVVESLRSAPPWNRYELSDARMIPCGADSAVLVYQGTAWRQEPGSEFRAHMASVYVRHGEQWRLVSYQQTPIPAGPGDDAVGRG